MVIGSESGVGSRDAPPLPSRKKTDMISLQSDSQRLTQLPPRLQALYLSRPDRTSDETWEHDRYMRLFRIDTRDPAIVAANAKAKKKRVYRNKGIGII